MGMKARKWPKKVEDAIKKSIKHWENMEKDRDCGETPDGVECPLCDMFRENHLMADCDGCPVEKKSHSLYCYGTPYETAAIAFDELEFEGSRNIKGTKGKKFMADLEKRWKEAARREIEFLKSLL